jgi:hydroxypyruvate isomerase
MPRFAANLSMMFQEVPFLDRFEAASRAGFRAVEYLFPYDYPAADLVTRLHDLRLEQALFNLAPGDWPAGERGLTALPGRETEFDKSIDQAIAYAKALGCPQVHAMAGIPPAGTPRDAAQAVYVRNLRLAAAKLQAHGIRLLIEPINTRDIPGFFLATCAQGLEVMREVGSDNLFLQADLYHWQVMSGDLAEKLRANASVIRHVQIAGNPGRHEPDVGEVNYPYLFDVLDELHYSGWVGCEYKPRGTTLDGLGWAKPFGIGTR